MVFSSPGNDPAKSRVTGLRFPVVWLTVCLAAALSNGAAAVTNAQPQDVDAEAEQKLAARAGIRAAEITDASGPGI